MAREVLVEGPVVDRPEARGRAVGEGEVVAVFGAGDETVLAGELLVEAAQVEQRLGTELVARRLERPAALGGDFAGVAGPGHGRGPNGQQSGDEKYTGESANFA